MTLKQNETTKTKQSGQDTVSVKPGKHPFPSFDELRQLASHSPEEFEALRQSLCHTVIRSAPLELQRKLYGLQFKIDMERQRANTPLSACIQISRMMHESLGELNAFLRDPQHYFDDKHSQHQSSAEIVPFPA